ncbi:MAG: DUF3842 family protein [Spirochaetales bacterium]|nr:DUF3842 family protein [Spirochaetales bacterium]
MKTLCVIDGMGGGIGAEIITRLRRELPEDLRIIALGANAAATERMIQARAHQGATGENAILLNVRQADFILGPLGIAFPNALMGEITPAMAESLSLAPGVKILIPVPQPHYHLVGLREEPLGELIAQAVDRLKSLL